MGAQKNIVYRLIIMLIFRFYFWTTFNGKLGVATNRPSYGLGLQRPNANPTIKLAHWVNVLVQLLFRNHVLLIVRGEHPAPLRHTAISFNLISGCYVRDL